MKYLSLLTLVIVYSLTAGARSKLGSECGLVDTNEGDAWQPIGSSKMLDRLSPSAVEKLPLLSKQQIIISAKYFAKT